MLGRDLHQYLDLGKKKSSKDIKKCAFQLCNTEIRIACDYQVVFGLSKERGTAQPGFARTFFFFLLQQQEC